MPVSSYSHRLSGIPRSEIIKYLENNGFHQLSEGIFLGDSCGEVIVGETGYRYLGPLKVSEVEITFRMEEAVYGEIIKKFRLNFLRAGG